MSSRFLKYLFTGTSIFALHGAETSFSVVQQKKSPYDEMSLIDLNDLSKQHGKDKTRALISCMKCTAIAGCSCVTAATVLGARLCCNAAGLPDAIVAIGQCLSVSGAYIYFDNESKAMEQKDREIKNAIEKQFASLRKKEHQD